MPLRPLSPIDFIPSPFPAIPPPPNLPPPIPMEIIVEAIKEQRIKRAFEELFNPNPQRMTLPAPPGFGAGKEFGELARAGIIGGADVGGQTNPYSSALNQPPNYLYALAKEIMMRKLAASVPRKAKIPYGFSLPKDQLQEVASIRPEPTQEIPKITSKPFDLDEALRKRGATQAFEFGEIRSIVPSQRVIDAEITTRNSLNSLEPGELVQLGPQDFRPIPKEVWLRRLDLASTQYQKGVFREENYLRFLDNLGNKLRGGRISEDVIQPPVEPLLPPGQPPVVVPPPPRSETLGKLRDIIESEQGSFRLPPFGQGGPKIEPPLTGEVFSPTGGFNIPPKGPPTPQTGTPKPPPPPLPTSPLSSKFPSPDLKVPTSASPVDALTAFNRFWSGITAGLDPGTSLTLGWTALFDNPSRWGKSTLMSFGRLASETAYQKYLLDLDKPNTNLNGGSLLRWGLDHGMPAPGGVPELASTAIVEKVPVIGKGYETFRRQMEAFQTIQQWEHFRALTDNGNLKNNVDEAVETVRTIGSTSEGPTIAGRSLSSLLGPFGFAPRLYASVINLHLRALTSNLPPKGGLLTGPGGSERAVILKLVAFATAAVEASKQLGGKGKGLWTDPHDPNWMTITDTFGSGVDIRPLGMLHTWWKALALAATGDLEAAATTIIRSKAGTGLRLMYALATGYVPYTGAKADLSKEGIKNILRDMFSPFGVQSLLQGDPLPLAALQFFGFAAIPESYSEAREKYFIKNREKLEAEAPNKLMGWPGHPAPNWNELTPNDRNFLNRLPEFETLRKRFETDKERLAPDAFGKYDKVRDDEYNKRLLIGERFKAGSLDYEATKEAFDTSNEETLRSRKDLQKSSEFQKFVETRKSPVPKEFMDALNNYYAIYEANTDPLTGKLLSGTFDKIEDYKEGLTEDQRWYIDNNVGINKTPIEKRFSLMNKMLRPYYDISTGVANTPSDYLPQDYLSANFPTWRSWSYLQKQWESADSKSKEKLEKSTVVLGDKVHKPWSEYQEAVNLARLQYRATNEGQEQALMEFQRVDTSVDDALIEAKKVAEAETKQYLHWRSTRDGDGNASSLNAANKQLWKLEWAKGLKESPDAPTVTELYGETPKVSTKSSTTSTPKTSPMPSPKPPPSKPRRSIPTL